MSAGDEDVASRGLMKVNSFPSLQSIVGTCSDLGAAPTARSEGARNAPKRQRRAVPTPDLRVANRLWGPPAAAGCPRRFTEARATCGAHVNEDEAFLLETQPNGRTRLRLHPHTTRSRHIDNTYLCTRSLAAFARHDVRNSSKVV